MGSRFGKQTQVEAIAGQPGRFRTSLSEDWNCPIVPHGGVVTAVALQAMAEALDSPDQRLRSLTTTFVAQVPAGDVEIDVEVLRRGRSMSQVEGSLRSVGATEGLRCIAVFGSSRRGFDFTQLQMPDVAPPHESPSWRDMPDDWPPRPLVFNFWDHVESRMARGHLPWMPYEAGGSSERVYWYRFEEPPIVDGVWDPLAVVALCDTMPGAVAEHLGSGDGWLPPSIDLTVHLLGDTSAEWILARNRAHHAGDGYASVEIELWDPAGHLLAYSTQMMFFAFVDER